MKAELYSIRDLRNDFWTPTVEVNRASAIRSFSYKMSLPQSVLGFAPEDFDLYFVGFFDTEIGNFVDNGDCPQFICHGRDVVRKDDLYEK